MLKNIACGTAIAAALLLHTQAASAGSITLSITTSAGTATATATVSDADATRLVNSYQTGTLTAAQVFQTLIAPNVLSYLKAHVADFERLAAIAALPAPIAVTAGQ
ncbi:MAG TPA: hypothetical protein VHY35_13785 [Stellaceae bacterium]|jgi:hypothetical protein|nr:hypothetical protein [Stellaceae bacterium]